jgi:hypothetical protein
VSFWAGILVIKQPGDGFAKAAVTAVPFLVVNVAVHESPVKIVLPSADAEAPPLPDVSIATSPEADILWG